MGACLSKYKYNTSIRTRCKYKQIACRFARMLALAPTRLRQMGLGYESDTLKHSRIDNHIRAHAYAHAYGHEQTRTGTRTRKRTWTHKRHRQAGSFARTCITRLYLHIQTCAHTKHRHPPSYTQALTRTNSTQHGQNPPTPPHHL